ncbi:hypothetical protein F5141DRAFT_1149538 [Pisolithus sp. B1]|nr:hypothetical protein F5141DRAFT_1149538 [Pisolithus sp. B1]
MNDNHPNAAPTGVNKSTTKISRYVDTAHPEQFAWYDVPGSSTLGTPVWQYFNSQGLYVFDCAILTNCHYFQIPTFIDAGSPEQFQEVARKKLIKETRRTVRGSLVEANLHSQRVYIVSKKTLFGAVKNKEPEGMIDEAELLTDLSGAWVSKRYKKPL